MESVGPSEEHQHFEHWYEALAAVDAMGVQQGGKVVIVIQLLG